MLERRRRLFHFTASNKTSGTEKENGKSFNEVNLFTRVNFRPPFLRVLISFYLFFDLWELVRSRRSACCMCVGVSEVCVFRANKKQVLLSSRQLQLTYSTWCLLYLRHWRENTLSSSLVNMYIQSALLHTEPGWNVCVCPWTYTKHTYTPLCSFRVWDFEVSWRVFQLELAPGWMSHSKRKTFQQNTKPQPFASRRLSCRKFTQRVYFYSCSKLEPKKTQKTLLCTWWNQREASSKANSNCIS